MQIVKTKFAAGAPAIALFRPKSFVAEETGDGEADVEDIDVPEVGAAGAAKLIDRHVEETTGPKLDEAAVVVAGCEGYVEGGGAGKAPAGLATSKAERASWPDPPQGAVAAKVQRVVDGHPERPPAVLGPERQDQVLADQVLGDQARRVRRQVGPGDVLQRRLERLDQVVGQLGDEPDGVGQQHLPPARQVDTPGGRVERGKELVFSQHAGAGDRVQQERSSVEDG